ncbi:MAG: sporulation protein [Fibrobacter sp.]|nr:sporulation protein [Fibrobacter sp.]
MSLESLAETLLEKLRYIAQAETVVGKPVQTGEVTIIPVSRVSLGFGLGGNQGKIDANASGGGARVDPVAFLVIHGEEVKVLPVAKESGLMQKVYELVPELISTFSSKEKKNKL